MEMAVQNIQAILNKNGFDAGLPDGKLGRKTISAIKAFQTSLGQEPTGKLSDALVKELLARNACRIVLPGRADDGEPNVTKSEKGQRIARKRVGTGKSV